MDEKTTIRLSGALHGKAGINSMKDKLDEAWNSGAEHLAVDLSAVTEMDFDAMTTLLSARNKFTGAGGKMIFQSVPPGISRMAELFKIQMDVGG